MSECVCLVTQSCLTFCNPIPARLLCLWGFSRQECYSGLSCPPSGDLLNPGIKPWSPIFQADYLPAEPQEKPNNTGVGSLSLLQGTFPTQKSNQGLLHCRWILYQLSYQGSPTTHLQGPIKERGEKKTKTDQPSSSKVSDMAYLLDISI